MNEHITITRRVRLPDTLRIARYSKAPEVGPRMLFFSGGTALRGLSRELIKYTHNSVHIITPFDSGGSSAKLREAFGMLAVGDMRNRLMALADRSVKGNPPIFDLFAYRFPKSVAQQELRERLRVLITGSDPLIENVPEPMQGLIRNHLGFFMSQMPPQFDLRGASIGNLILVGGYLNAQRHIDSVLYMFSKLVEVRGMVRPVSTRDYHLAAELEDGSTVVGQHLLTGKQHAPIASPVKRLYLVDSLANPQPVGFEVKDKIKDIIRDMDVICYPYGSFYTSLVANLLPKGVGQTLSETECPKVYIPNSGTDPEMLGMSLFRSVRVLLSHLQAGCDFEVGRDALLNFVLIDSKKGVYPRPLELDKIRRFGVDVIDVPLVTKESAPYLDPRLVIEHLLSLV
ncbi:MAG: GAK system CofD-like protein [Desulfovibrionaceae bacterium]